MIVSIPTILSHPALSDDYDVKKGVMAEADSSEQAAAEPAPAQNDTVRLYRGLHTYTRHAVVLRICY